MMNNLIRIGGRRIYPLPLIAKLQTDGSFSGKKNAATAFILYSPSGTHLMAQKEPLYNAVSSTEAEWASIANGLTAAVAANQECIGIENDCLGVVAALIHPTNRQRHEYARHYRHTILTLTKDTLWTGIRWIPRTLNRADDLFRDTGHIRIM
jgi:ribonuclease HI